MDFITYAMYISLYVWGIFIVINIGGFYLCKNLYFDNFKNRKIFNASTSIKQHRFEFINGLHSTFIFMLTGFLVYFLYRNQLTVIQDDFNQWGVLYTVLSFFLLHTWHDTYFYWTHRAMHEWKFLKKHHLAHHHSKIPTPLAAASFSKVEAIIQGGFYISAVLFIPAHFSMYLIFYFFITYIAAIGHVEFEFWPNSLYRFPYGNTFNSLTHHNLHHYYGKGNYGLYYRFWDEFCGTLHEKTYEKFYKVQEQISSFKGVKNSYLRPHPNDLIGLIFEEEALYDNNINIEIGEFFEHNKALKKANDNTYLVPHSYCDELTAIELISKKPDLFQKAVSTDKINLVKIDRVIESSEIFNLVDSLLDDYYYQRNWYYTYQKPNLSRRNRLASHFNHQLYTIIKTNNSLTKEQINLRFINANAQFYKMFWSLFTKFHGIALKYPFKLICYLDFKYLKRTGSIVNLGNLDSLNHDNLYISAPVTKQRPLAFTSYIKNGKTIICLKINEKAIDLDSSHIQKLVQDFHSIS